jgi:hypothetical protein
MKDKNEMRKNHEYVWRVLMPECFIKFYMDFFHVDKVTAERNIRETPLRPEEDFICEGDSPGDRDSGLGGMAGEHC